MDPCSYDKKVINSIQFLLFWLCFLKNLNYKTSNGLFCLEFFLGFHFQNDKNLKSWHKQKDTIKKKHPIWEVHDHISIILLPVPWHGSTWNFQRPPIHINSSRNCREMCCLPNKKKESRNLLVHIPTVVSLEELTQQDIDFKQKLGRSNKYFQKRLTISKKNSSRNCRAMCCLPNKKKESHNLLKVSYFQNVFLVSSILPKMNKEIWLY